VWEFFIRCIRAFVEVFVFDITVHDFICEFNCSLFSWKLCWRGYIQDRRDVQSSTPVGLNSFAVKDELRGFRFNPNDNSSLGSFGTPTELPSIRFHVLPPFHFTAHCRANLFQGRGFESQTPIHIQQRGTLVVLVRAFNITRLE